MQLYNTKTRKKEEFKPLSSREVKIYYCGPTVYNYAHIWNLRTFIFEDIVVKTLKFLWYKVKTTMNITDVDDKTIRDSIKAQETLENFTKKYTKLFLDDINKLGIEKADNIVPVTSLIPEMRRMIQTMLNRKNAYLSEDSSIYFKVSSFKNYWKLANLDLSNLKNWVRVDNDEYDKDSFWDFVLWKAWKEEDWDNFWEEEFKIWDENIVIKWRPGWHIECSACSMKTFWPQIDIHMGWVDLIFPHHQNEIAQSESCTKKEFSKYWLHSNHLMVDGKKMSKSLKNFYTLNDIEDKFEEVNKSVLYRAIRLSFINAKYSSSLDFSFSKLEANINSINNIDETFKLLKRQIDLWEKEIKWISKDFSDYTQEVIQEYVRNLEDDFNIPEALTIYHDLDKFTNTWIRDNSLSIEELVSIKWIFETMNEVLWIFNFDIFSQSIEIPKEVLEKLENRNIAKKEKDFELADSIRDDLLKNWYKIIDSREGSTVEKI
jgi:cysteinyl-tRNA synthetase